MYKKLAVQKTKLGRPIYIFWDHKCLNDAQNWETSFIRGLQNSQVILLLISTKVYAHIYLSFKLFQALQGIRDNARKQQDNVLVEYECAIILNKLFNVPVFPIFFADFNENGALDRVSFSNNKFPEAPHQRNKSSQLHIDELRYIQCSTNSITNICSQYLLTGERQFLGSIQDTMREISRLFLLVFS